jgi:hypothetical protein
MKANVGFVDKTVRIVIAIGLLSLYFTNLISGALAIILLIAAAILLITSFISFCPIWHLLGISTRKKEYIKQQEKLN